MNFNPLHVLDLILADWASPKVRRLIHNLIALGVSLVGIWLAANGDWLVALGALATAVYAASNRANTPQADLAGDPETTPRDEYDELDDGLSYEEAGGLFWVSPEVHVDGQPVRGVRATGSVEPPVRRELRRGEGLGAP